MRTSERHNCLSYSVLRCQAQVQITNVRKTGMYEGQHVSGFTHENLYETGGFLKLSQHHTACSMRVSNVAVFQAFEIHLQVELQRQIRVNKKKIDYRLCMFPNAKELPKQLLLKRHNRSQAH